ncbi:YhcN/YlaJ family sporulation lipoprotein [Paenibacillus sp. GYB003]|uniref:YhcN/YlaJ family sporulation lipoprotein n=1 Tax=Paenibacillus sp. GYB003 TaxID=2994392 RepID=UPI002F96C3B1
MVTKTIRLALLASLVAAAATGCANARHETSGTNDGVKTKNYRPLGNDADMRLGLDGYRGADPGAIRDGDSLRRGLNRDNGPTGFDQDGVNRWSDYKGGTGAADAVTGPHANTRMESAQDVANQLTAIDPVKTANVLLTDQNAYVAVTTKDGRDLENAGDVKAKITQHVQSARPNIRNVYVSANPDFVGRANSYVNDLNAGKPVSGFIGEFNTMVQRIFPTNTAR